MLSFALLSSCVFAAQQKISYGIICDEELLRKHYIDIKLEDGETGCVAPLSLLEGNISLLFTKKSVVLTTEEDVTRKLFNLTVAPENITFLLNASSPYAKKEEMVTLAEVYAYLKGNVVLRDSTNVTSKAKKAIKLFFNNSPLLKECSFSRIEKFQPTIIDTQFLGLTDTWLVFFPKPEDGVTH